MLHALLVSRLVSHVTNRFGFSFMRCTVISFLACFFARFLASISCLHAACRAVRDTVDCTSGVASSCASSTRWYRTTRFVDRTALALQFDHIDLFSSSCSLFSVSVRVAVTLRLVVSFVLL
jgi:hypothetical protein